MRRISFLLALVMTIGFIVVLERPALITDKPIPKLGRLLSPYSGFWKNAAPKSYFYQKETIEVQGLTTPAIIQTDTLGVPHIFAETNKDALFMQGYLTARDRLWQMDFSARATAGRLSELFGEQLINFDKNQRKIGLVRSAKQSVQQWAKTPEKFQLIQSYCAGVNYYIDNLNPSDLPIEFKLIGYRPERWSPFKVALLFKAMAKTLNFGADDIEMTNLRAALGKKAFDFLYPAFNPKQKPVIQDQGQWDDLRTKLIEQSPSLVDTSVTKMPPMEKKQEGVGSNNWVVSGRKTKSGKPILCNDPHLGLTLPSIWYMLQIQTPELNVMGVSLAGIPGIIIGFNEQIAWGVTNVGHDVTDWYKIHWTNSEHTKYLLDGKEMDVNIINDTIQVKGQKSVYFQTKMTKWGPIVYDEIQNSYSGMAMKWLSNEPSRTFEFDVFFGLMTAKNYQDYVAAAENFTHPAQNIIFASTEGDIAIRVQGDFPIKRPGQGRFIQDGSNTQNDWLGYISQADIPQIKNPSQGFLFSANQNSTPPSYPYYYNGYFSDYRCRSIFNNLKKMDKITIQDMMELQNDDYSYKAADALPIMMAALDTAELKAGAFPLIRQLKKWDYHFRKDELAPVLFTVWFNKLQQRTWDEITTLPDSLAVQLPEAWRFIELMSDSTHQYFDILSTEEKENFTNIATLSFEDMMEDLAENIATKDYFWKDYNQPTIHHLTRQMEPFSRPNLEMSGQANTINAMRGDFGPSWRMVVEMTTPIKAYGLIPGGSSGNPGSPFYDNMVDDWVAGRYFELNFMPKMDTVSQKPFLKTETFN